LGGGGVGGGVYYLKQEVIIIARLDSVIIQTFIIKNYKSTYNKNIITFTPLILQ
jgi:hypothetical protein